jgi:hypothetical protein
LALQDGYEPDASSTLILEARETFPEGLLPALAELGLAASARLRTQRHFAFSNTVTLRADDLLLTFEPTRYREGDVEVPFRLVEPSGEAVEATLRLTGTSDPLAIAFAPDAGEAAVLRAWPVALIGFADLTCLEIVQPSGARRAKDSTTPKGDSSVVRAPRNRTVPTRRTRGPHGFTWSSRLSPTGATRRLSESFVAGHRRHLHAGQHCSAEARAAARSFGIRLAPGETWVQPHERGMPSDAVIELTWRLPAGLADSLGGALAMAH